MSSENEIPRDELEQSRCRQCIALLADIRASVARESAVLRFLAARDALARHERREPEPDADGRLRDGEAAMHNMTWDALYSAEAMRARSAEG